MSGEQLLVQAGGALAGKRIGEALKLYRLAEEARQDADECAAGRWSCYMLAGEFERAWRESDAIAQRGKPDPHRFWDGLPFAGRRVLLRCLHGLGDTLQFVRYAPLLRKQARSLTIESQPKLQALLEEAALADDVITWGDAEPAWDQQMEVMELPYVFRTTAESIPQHVPYIQVAGNSWLRPEEASGALRVGLVWASGSFNPARSIPVETIARLFTTPGVRFVSLQAGEEAMEVAPWAEQILMQPDEYTGILATARTMQTLDLVISVDTMTAHLAGALATPVWTLLPYESDWRWLLERTDSPWYPTMRLFRQQRSGDWDLVIEEVQRELRALLAGCSAYPRPAAGLTQPILVRER